MFLIINKNIITVENDIELLFKIVVILLMLCNDKEKSFKVDEKEFVTFIKVVCIIFEIVDDFVWVLVDDSEIWVDVDIFVSSL